MDTFESWMRQQGLSESSVRKYSGAIAGPLSAWAKDGSIVADSLLSVTDHAVFQSISAGIQQLPIFIERNSTGHQMYSSALVKFSEYLRGGSAPHTPKVSISKPPMQEDRTRIPVSEEQRLALANDLVEAVPGTHRSQRHDLNEGAFRIFADSKQCAAVYFSRNAPEHQVEFALDTRYLTQGQTEKAALNKWLDAKKEGLGGHDAISHKRGEPVDWYRIGFPTYSDAIKFVQQFKAERKNPVLKSRWTTLDKLEEEIVSPPSSQANQPQTIPDRASTPWQRTAARMVKTAQQTTAAANGQTVLQTIKNKNNTFVTQDAFVQYVEGLLERQGGCCAITGLPLRADDEQAGDDDMLASLDRIDSSGHYEAGNLQVVCRFINRWKGADDNGRFVELVTVLRKHWAENSPS